ncbi:hypothetical protein RF11_02557 [Thelohanellus kitauei]|uniref:Uncharacterized protein n=1 Tax=Thelohanellus kitauei TaxID=669202 RepID=A0A0C2MIH0_THEKT|nr:hypothetical protein RF11_02557 [Thelohanellus kitauei]
MEYQDYIDAIHKEEAEQKIIKEKLSNYNRQRREMLQSMAEFDSLIKRLEKIIKGIMDDIELPKERALFYAEYKEPKRLTDKIPSLTEKNDKLTKEIIRLNDELLLAAFS